MIEVRIGQLKNQLSKFLARIHKTGETIIVYDRDEPVATLTPLHRTDSAEWKRFREETLVRAKRLGIVIDLPPARPASMLGDPALPEAVTAPDGRNDVSTVAGERHKARY